MENLEKAKLISEIYDKYKHIKSIYSKLENSSNLKISSEEYGLITFFNKDEIKMLLKYYEKIIKELQKDLLFALEIECDNNE